jgi:hypothetical protein
VVGRGAGKSRVVALLACCVASREYRRAPGECIYIGIFAPDRKQAAVTFRYVVGLLRSVPSLAALVVAETKESVELSNGVIIEVITASIAAPRGRAYALVIIEEAAFLPTDQSSNPDVELLRAVRPALARVPGSLLAVVSSPYSRKGVLWTAWQKYHDKPDGDVVLVQASTLALNPTFDKRAIERAHEEDPASAAAEHDAQFRSDVESYITREAIDAVIAPGRLELPRIAGIRYVGFLDFAGGAIGGDSAVLAIAHAETAMRLATEPHDGRTMVHVESLRRRQSDRRPLGGAISGRADGEARRPRRAKREKQIGPLPRLAADYQQRRMRTPRTAPTTDAVIRTGTTDSARGQGLHRPRTGWA